MWIILVMQEFLDFKGVKEAISYVLQRLSNAQQANFGIGFGKEEKQDFQDLNMMIALQISI